MSECALGVEISVDRSHTSVVAAGAIEDDAEAVLVDLVAYIEGTDATDAILALLEDRTVVHTAIDPHSPASTLVQPLIDSGVELLLPQTTDIATAHGQFLDTLNAGKLRQLGQPPLTAAVRAGTQRRLSGAAAWERRVATTDVSPLNAATLAVWAWHQPRPPERVPLAAWT